MLAGNSVFGSDQRFQSGEEDPNANHYQHPSNNDIDLGHKHQSAND
jgi:hypothetical protein